MEQYKNWQIEKVDYGYFEATNMDDCDAYVMHSKSIEALKTEIDDEQNSCFQSCSPIDFCEGGKCERMGCWKPKKKVTKIKRIFQNLFIWIYVKLFYREWMDF